MAYKFKIGDRASYKGKEGVINQVHKGFKLTYEIKWDKGGTSWFQGITLDKVVVKPKAANEFKLGDTVKLTGNSVVLKNTGVIAIAPFKTGGDTTVNWSIKSDLELITETKIEKTMTIQEQIIKELGLQVGDTVKITHKVPNSNLGWLGGWVSDMDNTIGKEGTVMSISPTNVAIKVEDVRMIYAYPAQVLEFVSRGPEYKEMKISKDYSAKVYADKIKVGCQTISIEDFKKLQKLVNEMTKK